MAYVYGKDFTFNFYLLEDDQYLDLTGITAPESIYVYHDRPSREDAASGASSPIETISTWSDTSDNLGKIISVSAITDLDPTSEIIKEDYYIAVNFKLQASAQTQTVIKQIWMQKPLSQMSVVGTTVADLEEVFPGIDSFVTATNQTNAISVATEVVKLDLETKGFNWALINDPEKLNLAVIYKALENIMLSLIVDTGDQWTERYTNFGTIYIKTIGQIKIAYDDDGDGTVDRVERKNTYYRVIR